MLMNNINTLIFDMDGLLVDTEKIYRDGWKYAFCKNDIKIPMRTINSWVGKSYHETGKYIMEICGNESIYQRIREDREEHIYKCLYDGALQAKPYAKETLEKAKSYGYKIGLATSSLKKRSIAILKKLELLDYIDCPMFSDEVKKLKPFPDLYIEVMKGIGCNKNQALAIEDSITGAKAAQAAGLCTILIPDNNFDEKQKLLESIILKGQSLLMVSRWMDMFMDMGDRI